MLGPFPHHTNNFHRPILATCGEVASPSTHKTSSWFSQSRHTWFNLSLKTATLPIHFPNLCAGSQALGSTSTFSILDSQRKHFFFQLRPRPRLGQPYLLFANFVLFGSHLRYLVSFQLLPSASDEAAQARFKVASFWACTELQRHVLLWLRPGSAPRPRSQYSSSRLLASVRPFCWPSAG